MDYRTRRGDRFTVHFSEFGNVTMQFPRRKEVVTVEFFNEMVDRGDVRAMPQRIPAGGKK